MIVFINWMQIYIQNRFLSIRTENILVSSQEHLIFKRTYKGFKL